MLSLEDDCYESNINTSNPISLFQESPNFAEYESENPVLENTYSKVLRAIEKNVPSKPETSVIFENFDKLSDSGLTKAGICNFYHFCCSLALQ